jgi:hypothetical protein
MLNFEKGVKLIKNVQLCWTFFPLIVVIGAEQKRPVWEPYLVVEHEGLCSMCCGLYWQDDGGTACPPR